MSTPRRVAVAFVLLAVAASWIATLGGRALFNPDEGRYAEIPREMLATGDWVIPRLNGLVYIEKPPLQYWATAASFRAFGHNVWAARLYTGLTGLATVLLTAWLARRLWGAATAWRAGIVCGSCLMVLLLSHQITLDMSLTFFMMLTLAGFCVAQDTATPSSHRARWMALAWAGAAGAFLTKGLIAGVLPVLALVLYSLLERDLRPWMRLAPVTGVPVFLALVLPWLILIQHRLPSFFDFFFVREHLQRYLTRVEARYQPWWFFVEVFAVGSLPWLLPMLRALARDWRASGVAAQFHPRRLLWAFSITVFVFFSASDSKLIPYILPMLPPLALLVASAPEREQRKDLAATAAGLIAAGALCAIGAALLPRLLHDASRAPYFLAIRGPLWGIAVLLIAGGLTARRAPVGITGLTAIVGAAGYGFFLCILLTARSLVPLYSGESLVAQLPAVRPATIYSVGSYDQSLPFYLRQLVTLVAYRGELDFGLTLEPQKGIATIEEFEPRWRSAPDALAVMERPTYERLMRDGLPMVVRAQTPRELIVSRR